MAEEKKKGREVSARVIRIPIPGLDEGGDSIGRDDSGDDGERTAKSETTKKGDVQAPRSQPNEDALGRLERDGRVLTPPFPLRLLAAMPDESSILRQCIDAMIVNVDAFGHDFAYVGPEGKEDSEEAKKEKQRCETFFATINPRRSFMKLRRMMRADLEATGNGYFEVLRDGKGDPAVVEHLASKTMRLTKLDKEPIDVPFEMLAPGGEIVERTVPQRFRRFVQVLDNQRKIHFREFGDPRKIKWATGKEDATLADMDDALASEVIHFSIYSTQSAYGLPRHMGNLPSIRGARAAERVNESFFAKNAIPAMMVLVSGGNLTKTSFDEITRYFQEEAGGVKNFHRVLVLEATPYEDENSSIDASSTGSVSINVKPLQESRMTDATHQKYDETSRLKVRSAYRLPPIYLGLAEDMNFATADASRQTAEEQIFSVERRDFDEIINLTIMRALKVRFWQFFSKGPEIADISAYVQAVTAFSAVGAMTANQAIMLANELLGTNLEERDEEWADYPFVLVMEAAKRGTLAGMEDIEKEPEPMEPLDPAILAAAGEPDEAKPGEKPAAAAEPEDEEARLAKAAAASDLLQSIARSLVVLHQKMAGQRVAAVNLSSHDPLSMTHADVLSLAAMAQAAGKREGGRLPVRRRGGR